LLVWTGCAALDDQRVSAVHDPCGVPVDSVHPHEANVVEGAVLVSTLAGIAGVCFPVALPGVRRCGVSRASIVADIPGFCRKWQDKKEEQEKPNRSK
jgi:hypothetical protein